MDAKEENKIEWMPASGSQSMPTMQDVEKFENLPQDRPKKTGEEEEAPQKKFHLRDLQFQSSISFLNESRKKVDEVKGRQFKFDPGIRPEVWTGTVARGGRKNEKKREY